MSLLPLIILLSMQNMGSFNSSNSNVWIVWVGVTVGVGDFPNSLWAKAGHTLDKLPVYCRAACIGTRTHTYGQFRVSTLPHGGILLNCR